MVSYLNLAPLLPCPWQHLQSLPFPCWACKPFTHQRPRVLWKLWTCQYQSTNGSHVFAEWKKPGIFRMQTRLAINGSKAETSWVLFLVDCRPPCWLTIDNAVPDNPTPKQEGPFLQGQGKQLRFIEYIVDPMQFITIMMITEIASTAMHLVLIPAKSSSLTDCFNPEPRWGSRYCHPPFTETLPQENQVTFLLMERNWGGSLPFVCFSSWHSKLERQKLRC